MKLKQIKLAGFKSFVDPTVLDLRSDLVGVVGPNGCGKSNVIDAVRWVMGESSAKTLRGESISDVIFKGSSARKPVGQASIELVFDNSDGTLGGEYAAYAEISVKREVEREGSSDYFLNGTRCRRRDIVDVFLGTGLGARSYSIIEQGMISRVIESRPEDLRSFIEEAAGISVYKKRRHDTELRMRHTAENLARLEDLREEQVKLLERLQRQAESAQKYQTLNTEKELLEAQLLAMRWHDYDCKLTDHAEQIRTLAVNVEEKLADKTGLSTELEQMRLEYTEKTDKFEEIQSKFYELGAVIARVEQNLQHHKERKLQLEQDLVQIKQSIAEINVQKTTDSDALFACEEQLTKINPQYEQAVAATESAEAIYQDARLELDNSNAAWDDFQQQAQIPQQSAEVQRSRLEQLDKQTGGLQARIERLQTESATLDIHNTNGLVAELNGQLATLEEKIVLVKENIYQIQASINDKRKQLQQQRDEQNRVRSLLQQLTGREAALMALQQAALGKDDKAKQQWLVKHNLAAAPRMAEALVVATGWEQAVETVLVDYLEAICLDDNIANIVAVINELTAGNLTVIETQTTDSATPIIAHTTLASKITTKLPIYDLVQNILVADDLSSALQLRTQLQAHQSIVTKDGIWLGKSWLRVAKEQDARRGVLQREQELQTIKADLEQNNAIALELEEQITAANASLHELEVALIAQQQVESEGSAQLRDISNKFTAATQKLEHMHNRQQRIAVEVTEHQQQLALNSEESALARNKLEVAIEAMAELALRKEQIVSLRETCLQRERNAKQQLKDLQEQMHSLEISKHTVTTKYQGLQHTITRVDQQLADLYNRQQNIIVGLEKDIAPQQQLQTELEELLAQRSLIETDLHAARQEIEAYTQQMKEREHKKNELERGIQEIKDVLEQTRIERQTYEVRKETVLEQLTAANIDVQGVLQQMPEEAAEAPWQERINSLQRKITNLGAINLAAMEELASETQRQEYLETQYADLKEAMTTLDNAIKKIDRETKSKFQETFDKVNTNFNSLFPKLFGGGKAYLEIVGEDLLEAGVTVMAMPPGKKNSTIHLLSGGEKALTAVALVFSIFQLNPAPFCMLDEVDAPLDESNVVRFSNLIKEMSSKVQFILITHNKTTMQIANQLVGVTMKEPGVSRLVSVDINEAVEMAQ